MEEKYYIDIDSNRKIIGRYLLSFHEDKIPFSAQEVSQEVFETSIQENHNYLSGELVTCYVEPVKTDEEKAEELAQKELLEANELIKFYENLLKLGLV